MSPLPARIRPARPAGAGWHRVHAEAGRQRPPRTPIRPLRPL